jgi:nucleoside 2-deoxyribosyltransferase
VFYVAHRLFAAHDRALGALVAGRLADQVGPESVFLPFCDTNEEDLVAEVKGRRLFELDQHRLAGQSGLLAILHGPSLDDGVCMEIGYAAALAVPIVLLTTDFITYGFDDDGPELVFPDPLIETLATEIIRAEKLGPSVSSLGDRFDDFRSRNISQIAAATDHAVDRLLQLATSAPARTRTTPAVGPGRIVFCEQSPYRADPSWALATHELATFGYEVRAAQRFSAPDHLRAARADWTTVLDSELVVADVGGPETPSGAAAVIGASAALGRRVLAYQPTPSWTFAHGREPNWRNLMIQYAVHGRFTDVRSLRELLRT